MKFNTIDEIADEARSSLSALHPLYMALSHLEASLKQIEDDRNPIVAIMSLDLKQYFEEVRTSLHGYLSKRVSPHLELLLEEKHLFGHANILMGNYKMIFKRQDVYLGEKINNVTGTPRNDILVFFEYLESQLGEIKSSLTELSRDFSSHRTDNDVLKYLLEESLRNYARKEYKRVERNLKHEAQNFKAAHNAPLTPEVWNKVLDNENEALKVAAAGKLVNEECKDIQKIECFILNECKGGRAEEALLKKILQVGMDDTLFDLSHALDPEVDLLSSLETSKIPMFHELVLRHNIIRCGIFPQLRREFDAWLKAEQVEVAEVVEDVPAPSFPSPDLFPSTSCKSGRRVVTLVECIASDNKQAVIADMKRRVHQCPDGPAEADYLHELKEKGILLKYPSYQQMKENGLTRVGKTAWTDAMRKYR